VHLLLHRREVFRCQRGRLVELDSPVLAVGEQTVDHAPVDVDMRIQPALRRELR